MRRFTVLLVAALAIGAAAAGPGSALENGEIALNGEATRFATIGEALASAAPGDRIELGSGIWTEAIVIEKPVTLSGVDTGGGLPTIDGEARRTAITLAAAGITLENLHVTTSKAAPRPFGVFQSYSEEGCVVARAGGQTIRKLLLDGCHYGIYLIGAEGSMVADNVIERNAFGGIHLRNSRDVVVSGNRLHSNGYFGITVGTVTFPPGSLAAFRQLAGDVVLTEDARPIDAVLAQDIEITGNSVVGHRLGGIAVGFARRVMAAANEVQENGGVAVRQSSPPLEISSAPAIRGYGIGLLCDAHDNSVEANVVHGNDNAGIMVDRASGNLIAHNDVTGSELGIAVYGAHSNRLEANSVHANTDTGLRLERGNRFNIPSVANVVAGNDLVDNAVNAFDTSGKDVVPGTAPPTASFKPGAPPRPSDLASPNQWDDGEHGNHFSDFDEVAEGFADADGDGISEAPHPIPGGLAVDNYPLSAERVGIVSVVPVRPVEPRLEVAATGCSPCDPVAVFAACPVEAAGR